MRFRQILLMHPSRAFRGLIKKFVFAEFSDVEIIETDNAEAAVEQASSRMFNTVLAAGRIGHQPTNDLMRQIKESRYNAQTPFVLLCEDDCRENALPKDTEPFEHVVHIRVRPGDLIQTLNQVCNPRDMRKDQRFYLSNTEIAIHSGNLQVDAKLINISRGGVLIEINTYAPELLMKTDITLHIQVPTPAETFDVTDLKGKLLRVEVADWHADNTPVTMRVTFLFTKMSSQTQNQLEALLLHAQNEHQQSTASKDNFTTEN